MDCWLRPWRSTWCGQPSAEAVPFRAFRVRLLPNLSNECIPSVVCGHTAEGIRFCGLRLVARQMGRGAESGSVHDDFDGQFAFAPAEEGVEQAQAGEVPQGLGRESGVGREHAGR